MHQLSVDNNQKFIMHIALKLSWLSVDNSQKFIMYIALKLSFVECS